MRPLLVRPFGLSLFFILLLFIHASGVVGTNATNSTNITTAFPTISTNVPTAFPTTSPSNKPSLAPTTPRPTAIDLRRDGEQVVESLYLYCPFFLVTVILYGFVRRRFPKVYSPRQNLVPPEDRVEEIGKSYFAWIDLRRFLLQGDEYYINLCDKIGSDAVVFLRILRLGSVLFGILMIMNFIILLPVFASQYEEKDLRKDRIVDPIDKFSMSNILEVQT